MKCWRQWGNGEGALPPETILNEVQHAESEANFSLLGKILQDGASDGQAQATAGGRFRGQ